MSAELLPKGAASGLKFNPGAITSKPNRTAMLEG
jgi:hypothetical protein